MPAVAEDRADAIRADGQANDDRSDGEDDDPDERRDRDRRGERAATEQGDPADPIRMVFGEAERPQVADRPADDVDPVDVELIEHRGEQVCDEGTVAAARKLHRVLRPHPGRSSTRAPEPGQCRRRATATIPDRPCRGGTAPAAPIPTSSTRSLARGRAISTNRSRGASP